MATTEQERILSIRVKYDDAIRGISTYNQKIDELKVHEMELNAQLKHGLITREEYNEEMAATDAVIKSYKEDIRVLNKEVQNNIKTEKEQEGSLAQLRAQLSNLTKDYDKLSREERESGERGKELRDSINKTTTELKAAEEATQRYYRNVGNYENAILNTIGANNKYVVALQQTSDVLKGGVSGAFTTAKNAVSAFGKQLLALLANPVVAILAAIAGAVMLVAKGIKSSEDNTAKWNMILAPFQRILTGVLNVIQNITTAILSWVTNGAKLVGWIMTMMEKLPIIGKMIKGVNDAIRESIEIASQDAALVKRRREMQIQDAKDEARIAELRKKAAADRVKDRKAQIEALQEIEKIEERRAKRAVEYAEADYQNAKRKAEQSQNDAATNDELAQKEAAIYTARANYFQRTTKLAGQEAQAEAALSKQHTATGDAGVDAAQRVEEAKRRELEAIRRAEDVLLQLIKDSRVRQSEQIRVEYTRRIEDLKKSLAEEKNLTVNARIAIKTEIEAQEKLMQQELDRLRDEELTKEVQRETQRITMLIEASKEGSIKRRELQMQQLDLQEQLALEEAAKEIEDEKQMQDMMLAISLQYREKRRQVEAEFDKQMNDEAVAAINRDYEARIAAARDNELTQAELLMEQKKALWEQAHQLEGEDIEEFNARKLQLEQEYLDSKDALTQKEIAVEKAKYEAIAQMMGGLSKVAEAFGEENEALAKAAKILALGEIAINTGVAISAGVKQAQSVPFPANIAAITTTVTTVLANIATAIKTVKSAKFAEGGLVTGAGTGTSDSIAARLSNGESVMTSSATAMFSPILSAFNQLGGGAPIIVDSPQQAIGEEMLAAAVARGMAAAPRPVVSVEEINRVENRVETIERLASL